MERDWESRFPLKIPVKRLALSSGHHSVYPAESWLLLFLHICWQFSSTLHDEDVLRTHSPIDLYKKDFYWNGVFFFSHILFFFFFKWKFEELEIPQHLECMFSCLCYLKRLNINALVPLCKGRVFEYVNIFKLIIHGSYFGVIHLSEVWICGITFLESACSSGFMYVRMDMNFPLLLYTKHYVKFSMMLPWQSQCNVLLYCTHLG